MSIRRPPSRNTPRGRPARPSDDSQQAQQDRYELLDVAPDEVLDGDEAWTGDRDGGARGTAQGAGDEHPSPPAPSLRSGQAHRPASA
ncbi:MAG: hypothetical protein ACRDI2_22250, partial [Chloroflexota bacterium]